MAVSTSVSHSIRFAVFDEYASLEKVSDLLVPSTNVCQWGTSRLPSLPTEEFMNGLDDLSFPNKVAQEMYQLDGVKDVSHIEFRKVQIHSTQACPVLGPGEYWNDQMQSFDPLQMGVTVHDVFSASSVVETSENGYRHLCSIRPSQDYPMVARIYKNNSPYFVWNYVPLFNAYHSTDASATQFSIYPDGPHIDWTRVDTSVKEFMVDNYLSNGSEVVFNGSPAYYVGPGYTGTSSDDTALTVGLEQLSGDTQYFTSMYHPVDTDNITVYLEATDSSILTILSQVSNQLPAASYATDEYSVDPWNGVVFYSSGLEQTDQRIFAAYSAVPSLEYVPFSVGEEDLQLEVADQDMRRLTMSDDSFIFCFGSAQQVASLSLTPGTLAHYTGGTYGTAYYGGGLTPFLIEAKDTNGDPVDGAPISITIVGGNIGQVYGTAPTLYTDPRGKITLYHKPPPLGDGIGFRPDVSLISTTSIVIPSTRYFYSTSTDDQNLTFLFEVLKDDPLVGSTNGTADGEIQWNTSIQNGRKLLKRISAPLGFGASAIATLLGYGGNWDGPTEYIYQPDRIDPVGSTALKYAFTSHGISIPDHSTNAGTALGGYWLVNREYFKVTASIADDLYGTQSTSVSIIQFVPPVSGHAAHLTRMRAIGWSLPREVQNTALGVLDSLNYIPYISLLGTTTINTTEGTATYPYPIIGINFYVDPV